MTHGDAWRVAELLATGRYAAEIPPDALYRLDNRSGVDRAKVEQIKRETLEARTSPLTVEELAEAHRRVMESLVRQEREFAELRERRPRRPRP
jgi:hypothetical protein